MRCIFVILLISLVVMSTNLLLSQEDSLGILGLGISIDPTGASQIVYVRSSLDNYQAPLSNVSAVRFYVPIYVTNAIRLEPSFGIYSSSSTTKDNSSYPSSTTDASSVSTIGIRGTYNSMISRSLIVYFGPRLELAFVSSKHQYSYIASYPSPNTPAEDKTTSTETDITFGGVAGAEYFPIRHFSVGGEIDLSYITFGNPNITYENYPSPGPPAINTATRDQYILNTGVLFFVRWYFL